MKRLIVNMFIGVVTCALGCSAAFGQATAQISGTVRDQTGAVLPGVEITATQTDTGVARMTITNETGSYVLPSLPVGPYRLEATLPGFRTFAQTGIVLQVNSSPVVNPVLEVGQVTEAIEVQANAALVETRTAGVGNVVENTRILQLPLNGRNITELISLSGAATPASTGVDARNPFAKTVVSIAGGLSTGVSYSLDGANHNNPFTNTYMSMPFPDALQEFKVETSATSAQNGTKSAGNVSLVTKSGTNEFHGDLFEFVRNGKFNARNFFATRRDTMKRNQFGGTIGGPISQNKVFFFVGYQGTTIRQDPTDITAFVPTAAMLAGDFTAYASPACNRGRQVDLRAPFVGNRVNPALLSRTALNIAAKLPQTSDPCGTILYGNRFKENDHMALAKIDYQHSDKHSIFGRYLIDSIKNPQAYTLTGNVLSTRPNGADGLNQSYAIGSTYLFSPNFVNAFRLSANRMKTVKTAPTFFSFPDMGANVFTYVPNKMQLSVTGGFSLGIANGPSAAAIFGATDDLTLVRGNHQMIIGINAMYWRTSFYSDHYAAGIATFNGQTTGLGLSDFLMGNVFQFSQATEEEHHSRQWALGTYFADTWKATPRLTLNYGLRWEPYFPQTNPDRASSHFDLDAYKRGLRTTQFTQAPPGLFFPGDEGFPGTSGQYTQYGNFSPRLGLAWDVTGDGKTSVRASAGTFYDFPSTYYYLGIKITSPWLPRTNVNNARLDDPWATYPGGNPFPAPKGRDARFMTSQVYGTMNYDTHNPNVTQWNLSIQRQLAADWLVSASYMGSQTAHLWTVKHLNPAVYFPGGPCVLNGVTYNPCSTTANTDARRRLSLENPQAGQFFGYVNQIDDGGTASYNGLLLSVQRRPNRGITLGANYTWSHCISDAYQGTFNGGSGNGGYTNPDNRRFDRGNCTTSATDRRHLFNLTSVAETPQFANNTLRAIASGWRLSPIFRLMSGASITVTTSSDIALNGIGGQRVNQRMEDVYGDKTVRNYLNPAAFALPATGAFGNVGVGSINGPGSFAFDAAISRTFQVGEGKRLEFRAEAFNVTNSLRMNDPDTNFNSGTFGQVLSAQDPRIMQFALKYFF
jgi:hypothetical protein